MSHLKQFFDGLSFLTLFSAIVFGLIAIGIYFYFFHLDEEIRKTDAETKVFAQEFTGLTAKLRERQNEWVGITAYPYNSEAPILKDVADIYTGEPIILDQFKNKFVVLVFWRYLCEPCTNTLKDLRAVQEEFRDDNIQFISVHTARYPEETPELVKEFFDKEQLPYIAGITQDRASIVDNNIELVPAIFVLGKDGKVKYTEYGYRNSLAKLLTGNLWDLLNDIN